jgi:hypothetical protein
MKGILHHFALWPIQHGLHRFAGWIAKPVKLLSQIFAVMRGDRSITQLDTCLWIDHRCGLYPLSEKSVFASHAIVAAKC